MRQIKLRSVFAISLDGRNGSLNKCMRLVMYFLVSLVESLETLLLTQLLVEIYSQRVLGSFTRDYANLGLEILSLFLQS